MDNPYQQAFEALSKYPYILEKVLDCHYELTILDWDDMTGNTKLFSDYSSDFFTLMQYFYKWQRGQQEVTK